MKRSNWLRLGTVAFASVMIGAALPGIAAAQTSGANPPPGVPKAIDLPKTGNPDADTAPIMGGGVPALLVAGGALTAFVAVRRRSRGEAEQREQE